VRGTAIVSSQHTPSDTVPERGQVTDDLPEVASSIPGKETWHVLSKHVSGSNLPHHFSELRPEVAAVCGSLSLSRDREGLTGKASRNHVRNASVLSGVARSNELPDVPEDGGRINAAVLNPLREDRLTETFNFDVPDTAVPEESVGKDPSPGSREEMEDIHSSSLAAARAALKMA
jgi:hypothetical protein